VQAVNASSERLGRGAGALTMGDMTALADDLNIDPSKIDEGHLARMFGGVKDLSSKIWALRIAIRDSVVHDSMLKAAESQAPEDLVRMAEAISRHDMMQGTVLGHDRDRPRARDGFRNLQGWEAAQNLDLFLRENTGRTLYQLQQTANLGAMLRTPAQIAKFLRDAKSRSFGRMILEYWINGLISGPTTHITYMIGNAVLASMGAPERLIAAGVGRVLGHTGERVRAGESLALLQGALRGVPGAFEAALEAGRTGMTTLLPGEQGRPLIPFQGTNTALIVARSNVLPLGTALRLPGRGVAVIHSFFPLSHTATARCRPCTAWRERLVSQRAGSRGPKTC
jgi:hypothetical protein